MVLNIWFSFLDLGFQNWSRNKKHSYIFYNSVTGLLTGWEHFGRGPVWHNYAGTVIFLTVISSMGNQMVTSEIRK